MSYSSEQATTLLHTARASMRHGLAHGEPLCVDLRRCDEALCALRSSFVTLHLKGKLRGCMGGLEASEALIADVSRHAYMAAFSDPRFPGLQTAELPELHVEVSVLSAKTPLQFAHEDDLLSQLRPGIDGLVIELGGKRATFLPSVWQSVPEPPEFLSRLKSKAGLDAHRDGFSAWRYTVYCLSESAVP